MLRLDGFALRLLVGALLSGCSGGGGTSTKAPQGRHDATARAVARPEPAAVFTDKELRALPVTRLPVNLDGVAGILVDGKTLHVYGIDMADRSLKRLSVSRAGGVKAVVLKGTAKLDHPFDIQRCAGQLQVTKTIPGPGNKWRLQRLDPLLQLRGKLAIPPLGEPGFVVPKLLCDGATAWIVWSTAKQTRIQLHRAGKWIATHQLKAPERGWPAFVSPRIRAVARGGKLHLLRSSRKGLEAILVGPEGEIRRSTLATKDCPDAALARVGKRFLVVWVEPTQRRTTFHGRAGRVLGRWLDATFTPSGSSQVFAERTPSSNVSLHLWASGKGPVVIGRTDRVPRRLRGGGFRYEITSLVTGYDVAHKRLGPWHPLGDTPIYSGVWIADTLFVVMGAKLSGQRYPHVRRFRFGP